MTTAISYKNRLGDLKNAEVYQDAIKLMQNIIQEQDIVRARLVYNHYPQWMNDPDAGLDPTSEKYQYLEKYLWMIRWVGFMALHNDSERIGLFKDHVMDAIAMKDFSMWDNALKVWLITIWDLEERMDIKRKINDTLLKNQEKLTSLPLSVAGSSDSAQRPPTVENWLKDYVSNVREQGDKTLGRQEYLLNSVNTVKLSEEEKNNLMDVILIYEHCKQRSDDFPGLENDINYVDDSGQIAVYRDGQLEKASPAEMRDIERSLEDAQKLLQITGVLPEEVSEDVKMKIQQVLTGPKPEREAIRAEEKSLRAAKTSLRDELFQAITARKAERAHAALRILAEQGALSSLVAQDDRLSAIVEKEVENRFSDAAKVGFQASKNNPAYLSLLLQALYHDRLGLKTDRSARFGMQLAALANKKQPNPELAAMVYIDMATGTLKWSKIIEKEGNLVFEENA